MAQSKASGGARPQNMRHTLRRFVSYMGHAKFHMLAVAVLVTLAGVGNLAGTYMIKPVVNRIAAGDMAGFSADMAITAAIYGVAVLSALAYTQVMVHAAQHIVFDIRRDLFGHIMRLPLSYFDRTRNGDVMSYFTNDVDTISEALNNSFANMMQAAIQTVLII